MQYTLLTPSELQKHMSAQPLLIDVRELEEWQAGHIKQAKLVPLATLVTKIVTLAPKLDTAIYLYCQHGRRSHNAALMLSSLGYSNIFELEGGISNWIESGMPCQTE